MRCLTVVGTPNTLQGQEQRMAWTRNFASYAPLGGVRGGPLNAMEPTWSWGREIGWGLALELA